MAITFNKTISTIKLLNAYNNNIVEFSSDNVLDPVKCTVTIGTKPFVITPNTSGVFRFSFREIVKVLMSNNFNDTILPTSDLIVDNSLNKSYNVVYEIEFSDTSTESTNQTYVFLKSVEQIAQVSNRLIAEQQILTPKVLTFFKGYPFDISHYSDGNFTITNTKTLATKSLTSTATDTERIFFLSNGYLFTQRVEADGGIVEINECWLEQYDCPILSVGINNIEIVGTTTETLTINLKDVCDGIYLKWFNNEGGWSYWLFNSIHKEKTTVKTLDTFNVDFESIENTFTTELVTGRTATNSKDLKADALTRDEMLQIKDILVSPRIELYNGSYGDEVTSESWQTVKIKSAAQIINNTKRDLLDFKLSIEINQYTQV